LRAFFIDPTTTKSSFNTLTSPFDAPTFTYEPGVSLIILCVGLIYGLDLVSIFKGFDLVLVIFTYLPLDLIAFAY